MVVEIFLRFGILIVCHVLCQAFEVDTCAYTFNIPATDCEVAPGITSQLDLLVAIVENQQATIQNQQSQLEMLTDQMMEIQNSEDDNDDDNDDSSNANVGTTYVRWGRTLCPDTAELVYEGFAGKSSYAHSGGGVDYQCLPKYPEFPDDVTAGFQSNARIYGVEYEDNTNLWSDIHDADVPCAVCRVEGRTQQLMIPAKLSCPNQWTMEYAGLMATQHYTHQAATYICVDSDMEEVNGGHENKGGGLLYVVEAVCGSLKCPPYESGYEIACSVCTR